MFLYNFFVFQNFFSFSICTEFSSEPNVIFLRFYHFPIKHSKIALYFSCFPLNFNCLNFIFIKMKTKAKSSHEKFTNIASINTLIDIISRCSNVRINKYGHKIVNISLRAVFTFQNCLLYIAFVVVVFFCS